MQRSPLALHTVSGSAGDNQCGGGGVANEGPDAEQPLPKSVSFHDTLSRDSGSPSTAAGQPKRSISRESDASAHTDRTVIVHENSRTVAAGYSEATLGDADSSSCATPYESAFAGPRGVDDLAVGSGVLRAQPTFALNRDLRDQAEECGSLHAEPTPAVSHSSDDQVGERELRHEPSLAVTQAMPPSPFESMDEESPAEISTKSVTSMQTRSTEVLSPKQARGQALPRGDLSPETPPRRCRSAGALMSMSRRPKSPAPGSAPKGSRVQRAGRLSDGGAIAHYTQAAAASAKRQLQFGSSFAGFDNATRALQDWPTVRWTWTASGSSPEHSPDVSADGGVTTGASAPVAVPTLQPHIAMSSVFGGQSAGPGPSLGGPPLAADGTALAAATPPSSDLGSASKPRLGPCSSTHSSASSLSHKSARPVGPMAAMHPEPHESESPSLRRSMSTGDEHELREAVRPSLLDWGVQESNIDWFVEKLNTDRHIDRKDTQDRVLNGLGGWYTNLAGDTRADADQREVPPLPIKPVVRSQTLVHELADAEDGGARGRVDGDTAAEDRGNAVAGEQDVCAVEADTVADARAGAETAEAEEAGAAVPPPPLHRVFGSGALPDGSMRAGSRGLTTPFAAAGSVQTVPAGHSSFSAAATPSLGGGGSGADGSMAPLPPLLERHAGMLPPSSSLPARVMHSRAVSMVANPGDRTLKLTPPSLKFCVIPSEGIAGMQELSTCHDASVVDSERMVSCTAWSLH